MNIQSAVIEGTNTLKNSHIQTAQLDTEILMAKVLGSSREYTILNNHKELNDNKLRHFKRLIIERANRKPIAYFLNKKYFWDHEFYVNKNTLIPRPDTEVIIEVILRLNKNKNSMNILDIGVGSGCILLTILKEKKNFYGTGIDICGKTLSICRVNSHKLGLKKRVKLFKSNIDNFQYGKYDLIISNPPYIKKYNLKCLEKDVIGFEPKQALDGGIEGLSEIRKVISKSSELIKKNGFLILEIGFDQKNRVKQILQNKGFYIKKIVKDLSGHDRCIVSTKI